ncbi:MAG TPA: hypothetical protein VFC10_01135 [Terriglobia bacterium]|nr:hypothetical protein [Terriglobia bacterium]
MDRRRFGKTLAGLSTTLMGLTGVGTTKERLQTGADSGFSRNSRLGFPSGKYTPFGYIDNPYHAWALHPSGVFRSVSPIGMGLYFPAGPGGYFDYQRNSVYRIFFRIGLRIHGQVYFNESDFEKTGVELFATHHSKNILTFAFSTGSLEVVLPFFQIGENSLACFVHFQNKASTVEELEIYATEQLQLGNAVWWGRDGLAGVYDHEADAILLRSFAAGPAFCLNSTLPSSGHIITSDEHTLAAWVADTGASKMQVTSYFPEPLIGGLTCRVAVPSEGQARCGFVVTRGVDSRIANEEAHVSRLQLTGTYEEKKAADDLFWARAPRLEGDLPAAWKHSWVYDFETLRMMVRRPIGRYKHNWDAMQIQAPRNVLAETSIDMWTLSYADDESAKHVLLGQFQDALEANVPCMREDGTMNMVAVDGSECGTAIQWCYPFYCLECVYLRNPSRVWLEELYPYLVKYIDWTLRNRCDRDGWIVAKCSWETGMDASRRFLIEQPTGGELIDFIRISELQAAMAHAAGVMKRFAEVLGATGDLKRWNDLAKAYAQKTHELWYEGWFYDIDVRTGRRIIIPGYRPVTQVGAIMCGVATPEQTREMIPKMLEYPDRQPSWLEWASQLFPYAESMWMAGQRKFLSQSLHSIISRVYTSMDRRKVESGEPLGWPGVSCEVWGPKGAYGGEGYGWGATLPAHIIRSLFGFREGTWPIKPWFTLGPNLPEPIVSQGKDFLLRNLHYRDMVLDIHYERSARDRLHVRLSRVGSVWSKNVRVMNEKGKSINIERTGTRLEFDAENHALYRIELQRN